MVSEPYTPLAGTGNPSAAWFLWCSRPSLVHNTRSLPGVCLDINVHKHSQVQVLQLRGPLRMGPGVDGLRQTIQEALGSGESRILVDLAEVPMIDSSGIGVLVRFMTSAKQQGGNIKLLNPSKFAVQTLRTVGLLNLFEVLED